MDRQRPVPWLPKRSIRHFGEAKHVDQTFFYTLDHAIHTAVASLNH
jgi:hypothetical protein